MTGIGAVGTGQVRADRSQSVKVTGVCVIGAGVSQTDPPLKEGQGSVRKSMCWDDRKQVV